MTMNHLTELRAKAMRGDFAAMRKEAENKLNGRKPG
jgi:hypothetical protein